jgi:hypothetical protein
MVKMVAPKFSTLAPDLVKSYSPTEDKVLHVAHGEKWAQRKSC